jgi:hypothetical protein
MAVILLMSAASAGESAFAMNDPTHGLRCQVVGANILPSDIGGADAICAAIEQALQAASPKPAAVEVAVASPYLISATVLLADGRRLPVIKVGSSDRALGQGSIKLLVDSIAAQVAAQQS